MIKGIQKGLSRLFFGESADILEDAQSNLQALQTLHKKINQCSAKKDEYLEQYFNTPLFRNWRTEETSLVKEHSIGNGSKSERKRQRPS